MFVVASIFESPGPRLYLLGCNQPYVRIWLCQWGIPPFHDAEIREIHESNESAISPQKDAERVKT